MSACTKHTKEPVKGYCQCPGCEVENLRIECATLRHGLRLKDGMIERLELALAEQRSIAFAAQKEAARLQDLANELQRKAARANK